MVARSECRVADGRQDLVDHCGDQELLGRKPAIDGADAHAGALSDRLHADLETLLIERGPRGLEDLVPIFRGVASQGTRSVRRHRVHHPSVMVPAGTMASSAWDMWISWSALAAGEGLGMKMAATTAARVTAARNRKPSV